jgi:hypothetical protein
MSDFNPVLKKSKNDFENKTDSEILELQAQNEKLKKIIVDKETAYDTLVAAMNKRKSENTATEQDLQNIKECINQGHIYNFWKKLNPNTPSITNFVQAIVQYTDICDINNKKLELADTNRNNFVTSVTELINNIDLVSELNHNTCTTSVDLTNVMSHIVNKLNVLIKDRMSVLKKNKIKNPLQSICKQITDMMDDIVGVCTTQKNNTDDIDQITNMLRTCGMTETLISTAATKQMIENKELDIYKTILNFEKNLKVQIETVTNDYIKYINSSIFKPLNTRFDDMSKSILKKTQENIQTAKTNVNCQYKNDWVAEEDTRTPFNVCNGTKDFKSKILEFRGQKKSLNWLVCVPHLEQFLNGLEQSRYKIEICTYTFETNVWNFLISNGPFINKTSVVEEEDKNNKTNIKFTNSSKIEIPNDSIIRINNSL